MVRIEVALSALLATGSGLQQSSPLFFSKRDHRRASSLAMFKMPSFERMLEPTAVEEPAHTLPEVTLVGGDAVSELPSEMLERARQLREEAMEMERSMADELQEKRDSELDEFFAKADVDGDGFVGAAELQAALRRKLVEGSTSALSKKRAETLVSKFGRIESLVRDLDSNGDGYLERKDIVRIEDMRAKLEKSYTAEQEVVVLLKQRQEAVSLVEKRLGAFEATANRTDATVRLVAAAVYLLPFLDALPFTFAPPGASAGLAAALTQALVAYKTIPFAGFGALIFLNFLASNAGASRLTRFSARHAILLDLIAILPLQLWGFLSPGTALVPGTALEYVVLLSTVVAVAGQTIDFLPGTGKLTKRLTDSFDTSVKIFLATASSADLQGAFGVDSNDDEGANKKKQQEKKTPQGDDKHENNNDSSSSSSK